MNFYLDHDVPQDLGRLLRRKGRPVEILQEVLPIRTDDLIALLMPSKEIKLSFPVIDAIFCVWRKQKNLLGNSTVKKKTRISECAAVLNLLNRAGESGIANNINFA